jgi:hypothetical protein
LKTHDDDRFRAIEAVTRSGDRSDSRGYHFLVASKLAHLPAIFAGDRRNLLEALG